MNVKIEKQGSVQVLVIEMPISPRTSASGKSLVIASTNGNQPTTVQYEGQTVILGLNAYVKK
jgi:hypothetical protein